MVHYYYILSLLECKAQDTPFNPAQMLPILAPTSDKLPTLAYNILHFQESPEGVLINSHSAASPRPWHPVCGDSSQLCGRWYKRPTPLFPQQRVKQRSWDPSICYKTPRERSLGVCWLPTTGLRHTGFLAVEPRNRIKTAPKSELGGPLTTKTSSQAG